MNYKILDTNILLLSANNITALGSDGSTIVLPETVLAEVDNKKSGLEEINYQARQVGRLISGAKLVDIRKTGYSVITEMKIDNVVVLIVSLNDYVADAMEYGGNDKRIIQVAKVIDDNKLDGESVEFISNDILCMLQALALGLNASDMKIIDEAEFKFTKEFLVEDSEVFRTLHNASIINVDPEYEVENYSYKFTCSTTAQMKLATVCNGFISVLGKDTERAVRLQDCAPINSEQLLASKSILDPTIDMVVIEGLAGSGKNIVAVSSAIKLLKTSKDKYENIVYIRSPQNDESAGEDIGYLAGNDEKLAMYLGPMEDTIDFIVRAKISRKSETKSEFDDRVAIAVSKLIDDCGVESIISTGLRGRTFHNSIIIIDEAQNTSPATMQKILTRVGKDCKVIIIGSQRQIDSKYVTKWNNGLAIIMDDARKRDVDTELSIFAINLHKVVRSQMALYAESLFSKD